MATTASAPLRAVVTKAWRQTLRLQCDTPELDQSWEAAGGDSIAMLELLLDLETRLGRKLDFMALSPAMNITEMADALAGTVAVAARSQLTVHLLPGQYGGAPSLARFKSSLAGQLDISFVDLPDLCAPARLLSDMAATGAAVADTIVLRQPEGEIYLAGYSFGGSVAFEAARYLAAHGRKIAFLGILDSAFGAAVYGTSPASRFQSPWRWLAHRLLVMLLWPARVRRLVLALGDAMSPARALFTRQFVAHRFRIDARDKWRPKPVPYTAFVAVSAEFEATTLPVWQTLLPDAGIARLPGGHNAIFRGATLDQLAAAFEAALPCQPQAST